MRPKSRLSTAALFILAGSVAQGAGRLLTNLIIGHYSGPLILGAYASGLATGQVGALLWPTTLGSAAARFVSAEGECDNTLLMSLTEQFSKRLLQSAIVVSLLAGVVWLHFIGSLEGALAVTAFTFLYSSYHVARGLLLGETRFRRACFLDLWGTGTTLVVTISAVLLALKGELMLVGLAAGYLVFVTASGALRFKRREAKFPDIESRSRNRRIDVFVLTGSIGTLASAGFMQSAVLAARAYGGSAGAGQFAAALTLATPLALLSQALSQSLMPSLARAWFVGDSALAKQITDQATKMLLFGGLLFFGPVAIGSDVAVALFWGDRFQDSARTLPILLAGVFISTLSVGGAVALSSHSQRGTSIGSGASVAGLACGAATWIIAGPSHSETGVALGYLVGTLVTSVIILAAVWRRHRLRWGPKCLTLFAGVGICTGLWWLGQSSRSLVVQGLLAFGFACSWAIISRRAFSR